ncbi:ABC transporter substrate-binding protein [Engelhardtia mirabilis]|uniref:Corrinoid ABC transporter substrate-binding protein n=1 Tax=Engelhardtia mirabilis TaxID=2528011 RepID=A0A518BFP4_9BACT|nr:corrinoid ABC transporter substrate-binding protein [Planctomycetes bacterium Pla133]QDV00121.1 corrinoid ABC transporter substrate-binding protein [Planctomycetes bacterium Pla86]
MRIASLLPSATELVAAVGARDELVGVSHECDFPSGVSGLPVLTRPRRGFPRSSGQIDRAVRQVLEDAITVYEVELDRLREAQPDVIVTQDLCDVCAVSLDDVRRALHELAREDVTIVSCKPMRLAHVWEDVRRVGAALGRRAEGERVALELERRVADLAVRARTIGHRPTVLTIEWLDPVMVGGTWCPELVRAAGGRALVAVAGQYSPVLGRAELANLDPDVVVLKPCGFDLERTEAELPLLAEALPWEAWRAVRRGRVYLADGNAYFNRPGPRLVESAEILAACVHPTEFADLAERHAGAVRRVTGELALAPLIGA